MKKTLPIIVCLVLAGWICYAADLTSIGQTAAPGEIPKWDGKDWKAAHDNVGVESVAAGPGIAVSPVQNGVVTVSIAATHIAPVGSVVAWMKSLPGTPALPANWVECNGQTLNDAGSVYNGQIIPELNGSSDATKRFLRGSAQSGVTGGAASHVHGHGASSRTFDAQSGAAALTGINAESVPTIPPFYEVVWIIRVK